MKTRLFQSILLFLFVSTSANAFASEAYTYKSTLHCDKLLNGNVNAQAKHSLLSANGVQLEIANNKITVVDLFLINRSQTPVTCDKARRCPLIVSTNVSSFTPDPDLNTREDEQFLRASQRTINLTEPEMSSTALRQLVLDRNTLQYRDRLFVKFAGATVLFYDVVRQCHEVSSN